MYPLNPNTTTHNSTQYSTRTSWTVTISLSFKITIHSNTLFLPAFPGSRSYNDCHGASADQNDGAALQGNKFIQSPLEEAQCPSAIIKPPCETLAELVAKTPERAYALKHNYLIPVTCQS